MIQYLIWMPEHKYEVLGVDEVLHRILKVDIL